MLGVYPSDNRGSQGGFLHGPAYDAPNTYTTHLAFYTAIWLIFFDLEFLDVTGIEFHGDSESAISFVI